MFYSRLISGQVYNHRAHQRLLSWTQRGQIHRAQREGVHLSPHPQGAGKGEHTLNLVSNHLIIYLFNNNISLLLHSCFIPSLSTQLMTFGFFLCLDTFLYVFTLLPLRVMLALLRLATVPCCGLRYCLGFRHACSLKLAWWAFNYNGWLLY